MKIRLSAASASVLLMMLSATLASVPSSAQELSAKELKKAVKQAGKAFSAGSYSEAIELYDQIQASTSGTDARRGDALYATAVIQLSPDAGHQDLGQARRHLDELAAFPRHPRRLEIAALRAQFLEQDSVRAKVKASIDELEMKIAAFETESERAEAEREEAAGENEAADDRVRSVESRLRKARAELSECTSELETKEEALQKLRDALVGGS